MEIKLDPQTNTLQQPTTLSNGQTQQQQFISNTSIVSSDPNAVAPTTLYTGPDNCVYYVTSGTEGLNNVSNGAAQMLLTTENGNTIVPATFQQNAIDNNQQFVVVVPSNNQGITYLDQNNAVQTGYYNADSSATQPTQVSLDAPAVTTSNIVQEASQVPTEEPFYVNAKQFHRIIKRREARARLEMMGIIPKERAKYLHESRHKHAMNRQRGSGGRFYSVQKDGLGPDDLTMDSTSKTGSSNASNTHQTVNLQQQQSQQQAVQRLYVNDYNLNGQVLTKNVVYL